MPPTDRPALLPGLNPPGEDAATALGLLIRALARIAADYPILLDSLHAHAAAVVEPVDKLIARGQAGGAVCTDVSQQVLRHTMFGALSASLRLTRTSSATVLGAEEIGAHVAAIVVDGLRPRAS